jgi:peptidoglycan/xylan/chitin deacetylase (PgdA/CDA1 family)
LNKRNRLLVVALALAAAVLIWLLVPPREPVFQERKLSEWLGDLAELNKEGAGRLQGGPTWDAWQARHQRAESAVQGIGPKALPHLVRLLRDAPTPSPLRDKLQELLDRQSWVKLRLPEQEDRSDLAYLGFEALGSNAAPAIRELSEMLAKQHNPDAVSYCLQVLGPLAHSALASALTNPAPQVRHVALYRLLEAGTQLRPDLVPAVVGAITNGVDPLDEWEFALLTRSGSIVQGLAPWLDPIIHSPTNPLCGTAMRLITFARDQPQQYVPLFTAYLADTNLTRDAALALARLGPTGTLSLVFAVTNEDRLIKGTALAAMHPDFRAHAPGYWISPFNSVLDHRCRLLARRLGVFGGEQMEALYISLRLGGLLDHPEAGVRLQIVQLLAQQGPYSAGALSRASEDPDAGVRAAAQAALGTLGLEAKDGAIIRGPRDKKQIALVFAGHEFAEGGETILNELARHKAQASFFLTENLLKKRPFGPLVQRVCEEGHYLGPHSGKHLLYCSWEEPKQTLVTPEQFNSDFSANLSGISSWLQSSPLPGYFLPPYENCDFHVAQWAGSYSYVTVNPTPGTLSGADITGETETNFLSSQAIFDSIMARERQDAHGLSGFILLFHLGSGPGRTDKFHARFGELLDPLATKGYQFVAVDALIDPRLAEQNRARRIMTVPPPETGSSDAFRRRYGLSR